MSTPIWIIVVNYRTAGMVYDCLHSLAPQIDTLSGCQVLIIDNDSKDDSLESISAAILHEGWSTWAQVLSSGLNGGFSFGNNVGLRLALAAVATPEYIWLLNPDTVVRPGALKELTTFLQNHPKVAIAGSQLENEEGNIECSAHRAPSPLGDLDSGARLGVLSKLLKNHVVSPSVSQIAHQCDWVSGASMLVRTSLFKEVGLLDEHFFLYFEEVDFCTRARDAGWQIWYVPESKIVHLEGASTGIRKAASRRAKYWYDSRRRYFVKHHGITGLLLADVLWAFGRMSYIFRTFFHLGTRDISNIDPRWFMLDLLWGDLRALLNGQIISMVRESKPS